MSTGTKLIVGMVVITCVTGYLAYRGGSASWRYYLTVDECMDCFPSLAGHRLRVSGLIATDTLRIARDRMRAEFVLQGQQAMLSTVCAGPLPDNLSEQMEVVVEGRLVGADMLRAEKVFTRCASKYESQPTPKPSSRYVQF